MKKVEMTSNIRKNKFGALVSNESTSSLVSFTNEINLTEMLMLFLGMGSEYLTENKTAAKETLIDIYKDTKNEVSIEQVKKFQNENIDFLFDAKFYERHFSQMAYSRCIDNLISYFKDILAEIVIKKPQILKSKETESLDFILSFETIDDLIKAITEKKTEELFYKGIPDIESFFIKRLGIQLFKTEKYRSKVSLLIKQRNLIVHNRGKISKEFLQEHPNSKAKPGDYLLFSYIHISKTNTFLNNFVIMLDQELRNKFKLDIVD